MPLRVSVKGEYVIVLLAIWVPLWVIVLVAEEIPVSLAL